MMEPIKVISDSNAEDVSLVHSLDRSLTYNEVNMTVTVSENCEDNVSYPGPSSTASDTCAPATHTGEGSKQSGSPIMRGLQNMLSIFRSSQSPIVAGQSGEEVCTPEIDTSRVSGSGSIDYPIVASTPVPHSRKDDSSSKRSSPLKESVIFNDELSNELRWNNDSTILFSKERIPIHKLFLPQILTTSTSSNNLTNKTDEVIQSTFNQNLNTSSEPMDVSFNESIVNHPNTAQTDDLLNNINNNHNITIGIKTKSNFNISLEPMDVSYNDSVVNKTYAQQINDMPSLSETGLLNETNNNSVFLECETSLYVDQNETELLRSFNDSVNTYRSPQDSVVEVVQEPVNIEAKINLLTENEVKKSQSVSDSKKKELINQVNVGHNEMNNTTYWENLDVSNIGNMNDSMEIFLDATTNLDIDECENNYECESTIKKSSSVSELNNTKSNYTINTENIPSASFLNKLHDSVCEEINNIVETAEAQVEAKLIQEKSFFNISCQKQNLEGEIKTKLVEFEPNNLNTLENVNNDVGKINVDLATISTESTDIHDHIVKDKYLECDTGNNVEIELIKNSSYKLHDSVSEEINNIVKTAEAQVEAKLIQEKSLFNTSCQKQNLEGEIKTKLVEFKPNNLNTVENVNNDLGKINVELATISTESTDIHDHVEKDKYLECDTGNNVEIELIKNSSYKLHDSVSEDINNIVKTAEAQVEAKLIQEKSFFNTSCQKQNLEGEIKTKLVEFKPNDLNTVENVNNDLGNINVDLATISTESTDIHDHIEKENKHPECGTGNNIEIELIKNSMYQEVIIHNDILTESLCKETIDILNNSNVVSSILENKEDNILDNTLSKNEIFKTISNEEKIESINGKNIKVDYETLILNKKCDIEVTNMSNHNTHQMNAMRAENSTIDIQFNHTELVCNEKINDITTKIKKGNKNNDIHEKEIQAEISPPNEYTKNIEVLNVIKSETESTSIDKIIAAKYVDTDKAIHDKIYKLNVDLMLNKSPITIDNVEKINIDSEIIKNLTNGQIITNNMSDNIRVENVNETDTSNDKTMTQTILENNGHINQQTENLTKSQCHENDTSIQINNDIILKNKDLILNKIPTNIIDNESNDLTFINLTNSQHNVSHEILKSCMNDTITPPHSSIQKKNKNDLDFDDLQNPFATKSKIRSSPPPTPNMYKNISIDTNTVATAIDNECFKKDLGVVINKDYIRNVTDKYHEVEIKNEVSKEVTNTKKVIIEQNDQNSLSLEQSGYSETSQDNFSGEINTTNKDILIKNKLPNDYMDNKLCNVTINVNTTEDTQIISDGCEIDSPSDVNTEDEDTLEGPFLDDNDFIDLVSDNEIKMDNVFNSVNQPQYENLEPEEMFIDAAAYDFLMNKNGNTIDDNGKESLFLKFDPLCAKKVTPDEIASALLNIPEKQKSSNNIKVLEKFENENDINYDAASEESFDDLNVTVAQKPTMAVMPAVNNEAAGRQQVTPTRPSRQSFGSPAIALIDRLLTISANNTPIRNNRTITHDTNYEQDEANKALTELKLLLSNREQDIENLRSESYELKSKLTFLENQMKNLETINNAKLAKINELNEKLESTTTKNKNMVNVVEEFERTIASLMSEIEQEKKQHAEERFTLINERDEQTAHLASMEVSFSDLHSKYEKSKQVILGFKANEDSYKKSLSQFEENLQKMQNTYELLKQHATGKLNRANEELEKINRTHESEVLKMNTMIKRKELHITSLEETLNQKVKANEELTAICDELINKVG